MKYASYVCNPDHTICTREYNMTKAKWIFLFSMITMLSACASISPVKPMEENDGSITTISYTSDLQTTIIKDHGDPERYCAARQSDVADTHSVGGGLSISNPVGGSEGLTENSSQGALSLGGRNPAVLIVREMLYRACELSLNVNADTEQTLEIYKLFIEKTKEITAVQTGSGSTGKTAINPTNNSSVQSGQSSPAVITNSSTDNNDDDVIDETSNVIQGAD